MIEEKELPEGWEWKTVDDCMLNLDNQRKPISTKERKKRTGDYPYYGATGIIDSIDGFTHSGEFVLVGEDGANLLTRMKPLSFIVNGDIWVNNHAHVLKANGLTTNKYFNYFFRGLNISEYVSGSAQPKLNQKNLKRIPIPLPPLPVQKRIVSKLDVLFGHLEVLKEKLAGIPKLIEEFRQSVLTQAVTGKLTEDWRVGKELGDWEEKALKDICSSITDGDHQAPPKSAEGIPFLVISNVSNGTLDISRATRFVPIEYFENLKDSRKPDENTILYTVTGSFGIPVLVDSSEPFAFQRHIGIIKADTTLVNKKYLFTYLKSFEAMAQARDVATGTAQKTVPLRGLRSFIIPIPPLKEQAEIVRRVESLFAKADVMEARYFVLKGMIDDLPQAVLGKAFRGELV